jgi:cold shock CspA family protein
MKWIKGKVSWFDQLTGDGVVCDDNGNRYYLHYTSILNEEKTLKRGQKVKFTQLDIFYRRQVDKIKEQE